MSSRTAPPFDRRQRRRQETIEEVLDIAVEIMTEQGVAGLSIGEIARRMGIRPPSLYVYFPSKNALYDALFARGARSIREAMEATGAFSMSSQGTVEEILLEAGETFIRWSMEHTAYSQLLWWRPVPGFQPTEQAYEPAVRLAERGNAVIENLQRRGLLRADVPAGQVFRDWTVIISGVISQQLANAPGESFDQGRFTAALPEMVSMFARHYGPGGTSATAGRNHHASNNRA